MGRPLNKKYFGNRNVGTTTTNDTGIGGEGVASVTIGTAGSYTAALPTVIFSAPQIPGGVTATGTVHGHALTAVATAAGTGYNLGDVLTQSTGGTGTMATWTVTGLKAVGITLNNGGTANDVGDEFTFAIAGFATPLRVRVTGSTGGVATAVTIVDGGVWTAGALPGNTTGMTRAQVVGATDMNGVGLQVNFTAWGVATVAVATQGDYTVIAGGAKATTVTPSGGTGSTLTITYSVSGVSINEKGSGYVNAADAAPTFSAGAATGTSVLTTDSGSTNNQGNAGSNQENAILASAQLPGGADSTVDIISQKGSRSFKVKDSGGRIGIAHLTAAANLGDNQMSIIATDANGNTYFVTKLTAHKATLTQKTQNGENAWVYANEGVAQWRFAPAQGSIVQIANA